MNELDRQAQMMDYLYGEMSVEERKEYEDWLKQHPEVQAELEELQGSRDWLAEVETAPPQPLVVNLPAERSFDRKWLYRVGAAAAVLLALWLFNFQIRTDEGGLILSFGHPERLQKTPVESVEETIDPSRGIEQLLANNQDAFTRKMLAMDSLWQVRFSALQSESQQQWQQVKYTQAQQVQRVKDEFVKEQMPLFAGLMQQLQLEQQDELRLLLVEFWNTWQETRQTDLKRINVNMTNMYENVERSRQESEARVVNYIQNVAGR
ncbi:MAG: hypothetical protein KDD15_14510 [Lewinella sp.]|nr:hypothetical protein [Lewinella sp.]